MGIGRYLQLYSKRPTESGMPRRIVSFAHMLAVGQFVSDWGGPSSGAIWIKPCATQVQTHAWPCLMCLSAPGVVSDLVCMCQREIQWASNYCPPRLRTQTTRLRQWAVWRRGAHAIRPALMRCKCQACAPFMVTCRPMLWNSYPMSPRRRRIV